MEMDRWPTTSVKDRNRRDVSKVGESIVSRLEDDNGHAEGETPECQANLPQVFDMELFLSCCY